MWKKSRAILAIFAITIITTGYASAVLVGQAQMPQNLRAKQLLELTNNANEQIESLLDSVYADDLALQKIAVADLLFELEGNITSYNQAALWLIEAEVAFERADYPTAISKTQEAMHAFRIIFKSLNMILLDAGLRTAETDTSSLLEAAARTLNRIENLRHIVPPEALEQIALLDEAEALLNLDEMQNLILEGKTSTATENLNKAVDLVSQVYNYLKVSAEGSNTERVCGYLQQMEQAHEQMREGFRHMHNQGMNLEGVFETLGYQNETEFMNALQNVIQNAESKVGDLNAVIGDLETLGQMMTEMNYTMTQEMNRHQMRGGAQGGQGSGGGMGFGGAETDSASGTIPSSDGASGPGSGMENQDSGTAVVDSGERLGFGSETGSATGYGNMGMDAPGNTSSSGHGGSGAMGGSREP